jgi:NAD(P)H dehydrogenase (quinone)
VPGREPALVVVSHPSPTSLNHALARRAAQALATGGHDVVLADLYAEGFDPVLPAAELDVAATGTAATRDPLVARHQEHLRRAAVLVVVHPNWWGKPPAMMAGWIDRVLAPGVAYRLDRGDGLPEPLLGLRRLVVLNTSETDPAREATVFGDPLERTWRSCVGEYVPSAAFTRRTFGPVSASTPDDRRAWLDEVPALVSPR